MFQFPCKIVFVLLFCHQIGFAQDAIKYEAAEKIAVLEKDDISESSGLAISILHKNRFWTHNDSGGDAKLFAFDQKGRHLGTCKIKGAKNVDWEDMAIAMIDNRSMFIIADVGDNRRTRKQCRIYLAPEPQNPKKNSQVWKKFDFSYEGGPVDCEAVAMDRISNQLLLFEKQIGFANGVYSLSLDPPQSIEPLVARKITTVKFPLITGADISYDNRALVLTSYLSTFVFHKKLTQSWPDCFKTHPLTLSIPGRRQGEAICFGVDNRSIFATSEKLPTPLIIVRAKHK